MWDALVELLSYGPVINVLVALITALVVHFLEKSAHMKLYKLTIDYLVSLVEEEDINVPELLERLILKLHESKSNTKDLEQILLDEKAKKQYRNY